MIAYRYNTMAAAVANAKKEGHNGTKWAWESAFSGISATGGDVQEIHLQAGIAMALRAYFRLSHDSAWLEETAWPMLMNIVAFFESRVTDSGTGGNWGCVTFNATEDREIAECVKSGHASAVCQRETCGAVPSHVWTGGNNADHHGCGICWCCVNASGIAPPRDTSCPAGRNCLSLNGVQSPNEYASGIDDDIYTNCAYSSVLKWISRAAKILGKPTPEKYTALAERIIIPFNATLGRHEEYSGAPADLKIKQSTVTMIPYPVEYLLWGIHLSFRPQFPLILGPFMTNFGVGTR